MRTIIELAVFAVIVLTLGAACSERDDTDTTTGRSGMSLHTDAKTGCQYLSRPLSGITPRLGADGRQICGARP